MLTLQELRSYQQHQQYPSASILLPTHRTAPKNKQDPIRAKNLLRKAVQRLQAEFSKREVAPVVKNLKQLVQDVDWQNTLDGLALFASAERSAAIHLPFRVKPRAVIDAAFAVRDLIYAFNRAPRYRVLTLSHEARLYDAWTDVLEEQLAKPFPLAHRGAGGAAKLPGGKGVNRSAVRDDAQRTFYRAVDDALAQRQKADPLPVIIVGVERNLAFYREVTRQDTAIIGMLAGNHDRTAPQALGKLVWPVFEASATLRRTEALVQLDSAVDANRYASGIDQVWRALAGGKVQTLLVEKEFQHQADVSPAGDQLLPYTGQGAAALDDVIDEAAARVLNAGGAVYFYGTGDLDVHQRIAAVLRP